MQYGCSSCRNVVESHAVVILIGITRREIPAFMFVISGVSSEVVEHRLSARSKVTQLLAEAIFVLQKFCVTTTKQTESYLKALFRSAQQKFFPYVKYGPIFSVRNGQVFE